MVKYSMCNSSRISNLKTQITFLSFAYNFPHVFPLPRSPKGLFMAVLFFAVLPSFLLYPSKLTFRVMLVIETGGCVKYIGLLRFR